MLILALLLCESNVLVFGLTYTLLLLIALALSILGTQVNVII